jgi:hypothetical protein
LGASYLLEHFLSEHLQSEYADEEEVHRSYFLAKPVQAVRLHLEYDQHFLAEPVQVVHLHLSGAQYI